MSDSTLIPNGDNDKLRKRGRTDVSRSSVMNLGKNNPRKVVVPATEKRLSKKMPKKRAARNYLPTPTKVLALLKKCFPLCGGSITVDYSDFETAFIAAVKTGTNPGEVEICGTPVRWIAYALGCSYGRGVRYDGKVPASGGGNDDYGDCAVVQLRSLDDMFISNGFSSKYLTEFILMDVIVNRKITPTAAAASGGSSGAATAAASENRDEILFPPAYEDEDLEDKNDYKYRTLLAFLPGAGVFYCGKEWRRKTEGVEGSRAHLEMSWFRIRSKEEPPSMSDFRLRFGEDGYVKRFNTVSTGARPGSQTVSAWRVSYNIAPPSFSRVVFASTQCADHDGPRMPPDLVGGHNIGSWPVADRAQEYNRRLADSNSARVGGRHYAQGCLHLNIPETCWIVDPMEYPFVDIIIDIAPTVFCPAGRKSVVMVRSILDDSDESRYCHLDGQDLPHSLKVIVEHNSLLRRQGPVGTVRQNAGDVGTMHAIGTRVLFDGRTTVGYAANVKVPQPVLKSFVEAFATVGLYCFPDVLSVVQHMEGDTSLPPIPPMDGNGIGLRVGYTIDTSTDLGNSSHLDLNDASQGLSVFTEEKPGCASNWYFVLPNLYGRRSDGSEYDGVAIKLYHGTAISWDGRVVRHCTSVSRPDGAETPTVGAGWTSENHLYGTFTAAKEKIVAAGRVHAAGSAMLMAGTDKKVAIDYVDECNTMHGESTAEDDEKECVRQWKRPRSL